MNILIRNAWNKQLSIKQDRLTRLFLKRITSEHMIRKHARRQERLRTAGVEVKIIH